MQILVHFYVIAETVFKGRAHNVIMKTKAHFSLRLDGGIQTWCISYNMLLSQNSVVKLSNEENFRCNPPGLTSI